METTDANYTYYVIVRRRPFYHPASFGNIEYWDDTRSRWFGPVLNKNTSVLEYHGCQSICDSLEFGLSFCRRRFPWWQRWLFEIRPMGVIVMGGSKPGRLIFGEYWADLKNRSREPAP